MVVSISFLIGSMYLLSHKACALCANPLFIFAVIYVSCGVPQQLGAALLPKQHFPLGTIKYILKNIFKTKYIDTC